MLLTSRHFFNFVNNLLKSDDVITLECILVCKKNISVAVVALWFPLFCEFVWHTSVSVCRRLRLICREERLPSIDSSPRASLSLRFWLVIESSPLLFLHVARPVPRVLGSASHPAVAPQRRPGLARPSLPLRNFCFQPSRCFSRASEREPAAGRRRFSPGNTTSVSHISLRCAVWLKTRSMVWEKEKKENKKLRKIYFFKVCPYLISLYFSCSFHWKEHESIIYSLPHRWQILP